MKKYIFMAVAGMLALSSCSNDNDELNEKNAPRQMTFTAGFGDDGAQRRASISGKAVSFDAGDQISILSEKNSNTAFTTSEGGSTATFTGTAVDDTKFYAVYPYQSGLTLNSSTGVISGITIPYDQSAAATSDCGWDPSAPIAYATTTDGSLKFHNACALLKITNDVDKGDIYVQIPVPGIRISGTFNLDTSTGELTFVSGECPDRVFVHNVPKDKTIYIAIAPVTTKDFLANWNNERQKEKHTTIPFTFEAGKIYDLGNTSDLTASDPWR